jgi:hypothetical protein
MPFEAANHGTTLTHAHQSRNVIAPTLQPRANLTGSEVTDVVMIGGRCPGGPRMLERERDQMWRRADALEARAVDQRRS